MLRLVVSIWYCLIIFFFFHNSSHVVFSSSSSARCHPNESSALLQLNATFESYNNSADCCTWIGVECDEATGHVVSLCIFGYSNNITTSSSLLLLRHLRRLFMSGDDGIAISEAAFKALARNLTRLEELVLSYIDMSSVTPILLMNLSSSLKELSLSECQLRGELPDNVFFHSFPKLECLDLSSNNLSGQLPSTSHNFSTLSLSDYLLNGPIPSWIYQLQYLEWLNLSNNSFTGEIGNFLTYIHPLPWKPLRFLDLHSNLFSGPLPILSPILEVFSVSKNKFSGEIPISICNLITLFVLDLSYNNFTGNIPRCIGNVSEGLSVLDLRRNKLHGTIPAIVLTGIRLRSLNLNGNHLEGALPRSLVNCSKLEVLDLGNNMLNDTFPDWLASLPMLQVLVLRSNRFHGSIGNPGPRFPFLKLRIMDLSHNEFVGALPANYFDNFKAMQTENTEMGYMGEAYYHYSVVVTVKGRNLELVKILTIFTTIDFSENNFTGEIPESVGKLKSLKGLNLSHNMLTGILPSSLGNLSNLEWLDLSSNELVGKIPLELVDVTSLENFNLSHNHLEGPIPVGKQFNTFGNDSYMGNSGLCGFPLTKTCGEDPSPPSPEHDDGHDSSITNGFNWKIVMMGYASGFVIGISIGYMVLYSNGKLSWLSVTILEELQYRTRPSRPKRSRNARRS